MVTLPRLIRWRIRFACRSALTSVLLTCLFGFIPAATAQSPSTPSQTSTGKDSRSFEALSADAASARDAGRIDDAVLNYRAAVNLRPDWEEGWWYLGTLLYDTDHFEDAIPALHRVVDLDPKIGPAWAFLGLCEFETGDYPDAYQHLQSAKDLGFSESPEVEKVALYHLGLLLNLNSQFERATVLFASTFGPDHFTDQIKTALGLALLRAPILPTQIDPSKDALIHAAGETAVLQANHEADAALRALQEMFKNYPGTPYLNYRYGMELLATKRYEAAEAPLREEIRITPRSSLVWAGLAEALRASGKPKEEAEATRRAEELKAEELKQESAAADASQASRYALARGVAATGGKGKPSPASPTTDSASFEDAARRAEAAQRAGRADEAATWYQKAVELHASWPEGWRQLGTLQYMNGHFPEAVSSLQQAVALDTKQPDTWTLLGLSEFETKDYNNSLVHLERGRLLGFSGNANAVRLSRYHLALLLNRKGEFDRAIDVLIPAIGAGALADEIQFAMGMALLRIAAFPEEVKPEQKPLLERTGEAGALLADSRYDRALPMFEQLVHDYPKTPFLHYSYGDALAATSMYDEAESQLRAEIDLNPNSVLPYLRLASIDLQRHQSAPALTAAKKACEIEPDSSEAHYLLGRSFFDQNEIPDAIQELETARRLSPNSPKVRFNLARAYARAGRDGDAERERSEFERLNAQLPGQRGSYGDRSGHATREGSASALPPN